MRRPLTFMLALALLVLPICASAHSAALPAVSPEKVGLSKERLGRIAPALSQHIEAKSFPGAVAIVVRNGRVAYFEAIGVRDPKTGVPMSKDAIFRLYSMTKPFASVVALMLVEDGKLRLNDPVGMHLPQLAKLDVVVARTDASGAVSYATVPSARPMTVYDLLRHTSGLVYGPFTPNAHVKELYTKANVNWTGVTAKEQLESLAAVPLAHQPGTAWEYSMSTDVVGRVVEAASGVPLGKFLDERLFRPVRMTDTAFHVTGDRVSRIAQPLAVNREGQPIALHDVTVAPKNDAGGAGAASTTMDYARFLQMLANGGQIDGKRLLSRATVRHMTSDHLGDIKPVHAILPAGYGFGLGFAVRRADGLNPGYGSAGEFYWGGAGGTSFWVDPKERLVAVLMTQAQPGPWQREFRELFRQLVYQSIVD